MRPSGELTRLLCHEWIPVGRNERALLRSRQGSRAGLPIIQLECWHRTFREVHLALWKTCDILFRESQVSCDYRPWSMGHPVSNAESVVLREVPVVEGEDKVTFAGSTPLYRVTITPWEIPHVPRTEIVGSRIATRMQNSRAAVSRDYVRPLSRVCVPVQLAQATRLKAHRHAGDA